MHCLFCNVHSHALVIREDIQDQGLSCWGSYRIAIVHAVDGKSPGHSPWKVRRDNRVSLYFPQLTVHDKSLLRICQWDPTIQRRLTAHVQQQEEYGQEQDYRHASGTFGHGKMELFNPKKKTNIESTARMLDIFSVGMPQMKKELIYTRKATWRNLSKPGNQRSLEHSTKEDNIKTRGCHAMNDQ